MRWNLKYSGDNSGLSLNAFLERVEELMLARNVTKEQVFRSAIDLFSSRALIWYRANRKALSDWDELVVALREEFQVPDYDERLFDEIRKRTQGPNESISMFVSVMTNLFSRLSIKIPESNRLKMMCKNLSPFYQSQLGLTDINRRFTKVS
ncbi:Retrotransposon gag protein [Popillia japonica]|uniref:Retrotransposon gag protein n=1 Tax=Popillia japonica TaxID=7064 RepID=A0AAW1IGD4_POPJA